LDDLLGAIRSDPNLARAVAEGEVLLGNKVASELKRMAADTAHGAA
jgi:hypothetical protein